MSNDTAGVIFQLLGAAALLSCAWTLYRQHRVSHWMFTAGEVLQSSIEHDSDLNSYPNIRYRYTVRGRAYESSKIHPHGRLTTTGSYAAKLVARYPAGQIIRVYYNPERPEDAACKRQLPFPVPLLQLAVGITFIVIGVYLARLNAFVG